MTLFGRAALLDLPVLAVAVAVEVDAAKVLAYVAGGFFAALSLLLQREWKRHAALHIRTNARLNALERGERPPPESSE